jgi:hypothetical protein
MNRLVSRMNANILKVRARIRKGIAILTVLGTP